MTADFLALHQPNTLGTIRPRHTPAPLQGSYCTVIIPHASKSRSVQGCLVGFWLFPSVFLALFLDHLVLEEKTLENVHRFLTFSTSGEIIYRGCLASANKCHSKAFKVLVVQKHVHNQLTPKCIRYPEIAVTETVSDLLTDLLPTKPNFTPDLHSLKLA